MSVRLPRHSSCPGVYSCRVCPPNLLFRHGMGSRFANDALDMPLQHRPHSPSIAPILGNLIHPVQEPRRKILPARVQKVEVDPAFVSGQASSAWVKQGSPKPTPTGELAGGVWSSSLACIDLRINVFWRGVATFIFMIAQFKNRKQYSMDAADVPLPVHLPSHVEHPLA